jgi:hypothetical protein
MGDSEQHNDAKAEQDLNQASEEHDDEDRQWTVTDTITTAGEFLVDGAAACADGVIGKAANLGSAALSGAAQAGESIAEGAVDAVSTVIGSIGDH